jgi:hypothetical protein
MNEIVELINEIHEYQEFTYAKFPEIIHKDEFDLTGFSEQESYYPSVDVVYTDVDYGFYGTMAIPCKEHFIVFEYCA